MYTVIVTSRRETEQILVQGYEKEDVDVVKNEKNWSRATPAEKE